MKKFWGIRHVRYYFALLRFWLWWNREGHKLGAFPNTADFDYLDGIRAGEF